MLRQQASSLLGGLVFFDRNNLSGHDIPNFQFGGIINRHFLSSFSLLDNRPCTIMPNNITPEGRKMDIPEKKQRKPCIKQIDPKKAQHPANLDVVPSWGLFSSFFFAVIAARIRSLMI